MSANNEQVTLFTTFNAKGYEQYGRNMLHSFSQRLPADVRLLCYVDGFAPDFSHPKIQYRDLHGSSQALVDFKRKFGKFELAHGIVRRKDAQPVYNYNYDAIKFCHKVFCITHALRNVDTRYACWVDGDTIAKQPIPQGFFQSLLKDGAYTCYLGRSHMYSECGFVGYDTRHEQHENFVYAYEHLFNTGDIFNLGAWHDCEAYDVVRKAFEDGALLTGYNISAEFADTMHPFVNSVLGRYMDHLKGPQRKAAGHSFETDYRQPVPQPAAPPTRKNRTISSATAPVGMTSGRYSQINALIARIKPTTIAEIGTWNGYRAMEMAKEALKHQPRVTYYGFDLFEQANDQTDAEEKNVKPHYTKELVSQFLDNFKRDYPGFDYVLTAGNTRETLKPMAVDFAFIDGGHSVETIRTDYEALKDSKFILFDDYYEGGIDTNLYGCNRIIEQLKHTVLPIGDGVNGGGITKFVMVEHA
ncbi:MAG: class I SAM-dependent methyltransferase [Steroidobacteraceae bacterium]